MIALGKCGEEQEECKLERVSESMKERKVRVFSPYQPPLKGMTVA